MNRRNHDLKLSTPCVTSYTVVANLMKKEFSSVLEDIKILTSSDQKLNCYEVCNLLKALYPSNVELQTESGKKLLLDLLLPSIELCIDFARTHFSCSDLAKDGFMKVFYHIIRTFLNVELYETVLKYGKVFKHFVEDPECYFEGKNACIKNLASMFWNATLKKTLDPETILALRELNIEFLLMKIECINQTHARIDQAVKEEGTNQTQIIMNQAVRDYLKSGHMDELKLQVFMQSILSHLAKLGDDPEHKASMFKVLQSWCSILLQYHTDFTFMRHFLPWFQDLSKRCTKEEKILNTCCDLSKMCIQFFNLLETGLKIKKSYLNCANFFKNSKGWSQIDAETVTCMGELIFFCLHAHHGKFGKKSENGRRMSYLESNIQVCGTLISYLVASYKKTIEKNLDLYLTRLFFSCNFFNQYLLTILKDENNEAKENLLLSEAKPFLNFTYCTITQLQESSTTYKFITDYATRIRNFGLVLYQKKLYYESIYFFTMNVKLLLKFKSLPEFNMKETQEAFGHQTLECSVYALLKYAKYEEALRFVADALTICQNKSKECFDSWKRVKKEAARNGYKGVTSKIISDVLQEMDTDIQPDKEIVYLIEEYKLCKSERSNFEEEMLVVYQRLLEMPLSSFDRGYLYIGSLTVATNVSEKLSAILKKSLSEICQQGIDLLTDCIAKNPQHSLGKLYLSIAYFWIYENNLKKIYEIAEKESQNILKPPSLKPSVGIQNDVEEENDTCDIQPVHHLVSLSVETECFKHLNLAVELWEDISKAEWQTMSATVKAENVCDMIQATAETYSTAVHDLKELKLWILLRSISMAVDSKIHLLTSSLSLANFLTRLGYLNMSFCILEEIKDTDCFGSESEIEKARFELAWASYFLHAEKFDDGLDILRAILKSPDIKKPQKSSKMLWVETMLLLGEFLSLPTKAYSRTENIKFIVESSPLASLMEAVVSSKSILKHLIDNQPIFANHYDWIHFKQKMIRALLRAHVLLGDLYFKSGEPRYARSMLQESLKVAESHILTYWSSRILLILGQIDLICDNFNDCHVKESGLKYILYESPKPNILEFLIHGQNKSDTSSTAMVASPDYADELVMASVPDITLSRHIKQEFIDKIDIVSSPVSKQNLKNKFSQLFRYNFDEEHFSMSVLKLETFLLFYTSSKRELDSKKAVEIIQMLLNHCHQLKSSKCLSDTLKLVNVSFKVEEPFSRSQTRCEILLIHSIQVQKIELHCIQNDISSAKRTVKKSIDFFEKALKLPRYSYPDTYALLKYHDILITLCEFYEIPLSSSLVHHICPSVKPYVLLKKKGPMEKSENLPNTPVNKIPKIVVSKHKSGSKKCGAPLKKNLLNTNLKKDLESENFPPENSPAIIFSSSDEEENFESPFNSLSRASKTRSGPKNAAKRIDSYKFFKQKNSAVVTDASDVWNLCLTDTPKLGKENRKLRSATARTTRSKALEISKTRIPLANSVSQQPKTSRTRRRIKTSYSSPVSKKVDELVKDIDCGFSSIPEKKKSIENSRSSPLDESKGACSESSAIEPSETLKNSNSQQLEISQAINTSYSPPVSTNCQVKKMNELIKHNDYGCSDSQQPKRSRTRRRIKTTYSSPVSKKIDELVKDINDGFVSIPERKAAIEISRNSPLNESKEAFFEPSETSEGKIPFANTNSQQPKSSRTRSKIKTSCYSPVSKKMDGLIKDIVDGFSSIPERKAFIENSRSSPFDKNKEADLLSGSSNMDALNPGFSAEMMTSDNVFLTPLQNTQKKKVGNLIDILCNDLSSLSLQKSKSHIVAGNFDEILSELSELRLLVENSLSYLLYTNICKLLAVLYLAKRKVIGEDERTLHSSFLLSEAFSVSLRSFYIGRVLYYKEPEFFKERQLVINTIKGPYSNIDLQMESFLSAIPDNWSVVQICAFFEQEYLATSNSSPFPTKFLITQYQKNSKPIIVGMDCSSGEKSSANLLMEFQRIISESEVTMLNKDIRTWWTTRSSLDVRLKNLIKDIENIWLGCWKGFFLGLPQDGERIKHLSFAVDVITKIAPCQNEKLLQILIDSAQFLTSEQVCTAVCYLWKCIHTNDIHIKLCKNIRQLSTTLPNTGRHPLILILDQSVQDIPWESMPIAKGVPISRMPSLSLLHLKLRMMLDGTVMDRGFDSSKTFYVLNPAGDLIHSQQFLQDQFKRQKNWKGIIGKAPKVEDYVSGYKDHELFIYCGHGSGRRYFEGACVDKLMLQSTSVLMGCSSGKLKRLGRVFEAGGIVLKLLLRGCPSVVANLWNVTDGDIDRFTERFLQYLIPNYDDVTDTTYNIAKSVSLARNACKMVHLVGAAPVVYGLPVFAMPE